MIVIMLFFVYINKCPTVASKHLAANPTLFRRKSIRNLWELRVLCGLAKHLIDFFF